MTEFGGIGRIVNDSLFVDQPYVMNTGVESDFFQNVRDIFILTQLHNMVNAAANHIQGRFQHGFGTLFKIQPELIDQEKGRDTDTDQHKKNGENNKFTFDGFKQAHA